MANPPGERQIITTGHQVEINEWGDQWTFDKPNGNKNYVVVVMH